MPRGILNWTFKDVVSVLREHRFNLNHIKGSHYYYVGYVAKSLRQVTVPFHGSGTIKPRTLRSIIRQSGIPRDEWIG
jgi:predicted RNA binding protein YcfA (HicA-like mRNA interferase family)